MKWIALAPMIVFLTACGCCRNAEVLEYRQVSYTPAVIATSKAVVVRPIYYDPVTVIDEDPVDVTTTTIDYY